MCLVIQKDRHHKILPTDDRVQHFLLRAFSIENAMSDSILIITKVFDVLMTVLTIPRICTQKHAMLSTVVKTDKTVADFECSFFIQ